MNVYIRHIRNYPDINTDRILNKITMMVERYGIPGLIYTLDNKKCTSTSTMIIDFLRYKYDVIPEMKITENITDIDNTDMESNTWYICDMETIKDIQNKYKLNVKVDFFGHFTLLSK